MLNNMSKTYSAHPVLALEQLQCSELEKNHSTQHNTMQHRRHYSSNKIATPLHVATLKQEQEQKTLPDRTVLHKDDIDAIEVFDEDELTDNNITKDYKNCAAAELTEDEPDALQQRFSCTNPTSATTIDDTSTDSRIQSTHNAALNRHHLSQLPKRLARDMDSSGYHSGGCLSGMSSMISSPSASTVSTPLSTPTRLTPHHQLHKHTEHCCHKSTTAAAAAAAASVILGNSIHAGAAGSATKSTSTPTLLTTAIREKHSMPQKPEEHSQKEYQSRNHNFHPHYHHHQHQYQHHTTLSSSGKNNGSKKLKIFDPRQGPSPYRQLLPIALCILSFAVVFSLLMIYMDTTEICHQQFRLNMSRDYDMFGVAQDDPQLIVFLREIHMRKYPMHFLKSRDTVTDTSASSSTSMPTATPTATSAGRSEERLNFNISHDASDFAPQMAHYVATLVGNKPHEGAVIQSLPGSLVHLLTAPWLAETLSWVGVIVEPEPRRYFALRKQNAQRQGMEVLHACVSPTPYPKEVTIHNEASEVRINSLLDEETSWFNSRVKCFPLYTIMLAYNRTQYDLLSLGVHGHELEILQTLPFEKVQIEVISIHLPDDHEDARSGSSETYIEEISKFLMSKSYRMQRQFGRNFFYQRYVNNSTSRTRKKDILMLKAP